MCIRGSTKQFGKLSKWLGRTGQVTLDREEGHFELTELKGKTREAREGLNIEVSDLVLDFRASKKRLGALLRAFSSPGEKRY